MHHLVFSSDLNKRASILFYLMIRGTHFATT